MTSTLVCVKLVVFMYLVGPCLCICPSYFGTNLQDFQAKWWKDELNIKRYHHLLRSSYKSNVFLFAVGQLATRYAMIIRNVQCGLGIMKMLENGNTTVV